MVFTVSNILKLYNNYFLAYLYMSSLRTKLEKKRKNYKDTQNYM